MNLENIVIDYSWIWWSVGVVVFFVVTRVVLGYVRPGFVLPASKVSKIRKVLYGLLVWLILVVCLVLPLNIGLLQESKDVKTETLDVQVLFNVSLSMTSKDVYPSRIELSRKYLSKFIDQIYGYNKSIIVFSGKPVVYAPFTTHTDLLRAKVDNMDIGYYPPTFEFVGTGKWDAILYGVSHLLKHSDNDTEPWVLVLFTDGDSNKWHDPVNAAKYASNNDVPIFSLVVWEWDDVIGIDNYGTQVGTEFDLELMDDITEASGGEYFVIQDQQDFQEGVEYIKDYVKAQEEEYIVYERVSFNTYLYILLSGLLLCLSVIKVSMLWYSREQFSQKVKL